MAEAGVGGVDAAAEAPAAPQRRGPSLTVRDYLEGTKDLAVSTFFVVPLLLLYEVGIVAYGSELRNGADVLMKTMFSLLGPRGLFVFNLLLFGVMAAAAIRVLRRGKPVFALYPVMMLESLAFAFVLPIAVEFVKRVVPLLASGAAPAATEPWAVQLFLSVGAGVYEEALFRLGLLSLLLLLFERTFKFRKVPATILSVAIASALFSGFHHVGPLGDAFDAERFVFRFLAGVLLSALFLFRGFGVVVHTHALYDVWVFFLRSSSS